GIRAPLASMVCMRSSTEGRRITGLADEADFDIKLERRPDPVGREYRCCLTRRKRQARAVAKRKPARSRMRNEGTHLFGLRGIKIDPAGRRHAKRGTGRLQRAGALDQLRDDFRMIDAQHERFTDESRDNVSAWLPVNEGKQCRTIENDTAHSSISRAAS